MVSRHFGSTFTQFFSSRAPVEVNTPQETLLNPRGMSLEGFGSASTSTEQAEIAQGAAQFLPLSHGHSAMVGSKRVFGLSVTHLNSMICSI